MAMLIVVVVGLAIVDLVESGAHTTVYYGNLETIPYTKRKHLVLLSRTSEKQMGESRVEKIKATFKGKILPATHSESVRVRLIAKDIIEALQRGLRKEQVWSDPGYASDIDAGTHNRAHKTLAVLSESAEGKCAKEDDKWVQKSRKKGHERGSKSATGHLEGLNWEVLVVDEPFVNAFCLPGGKIVVFTGLLKHFRSDEEIATIIGHEVGHAVARHEAEGIMKDLWFTRIQGILCLFLTLNAVNTISNLFLRLPFARRVDADIATIIGHEVGHAVARHVAEGITKNLWFTVIQLILYQFVMFDVVSTMSNLFLWLPFTRRMEMEADHIGLLLVASAGYDPRVVPKVYEKQDQLLCMSALGEYISNHPSPKKRAKVLAQAKVMDEALAIYREVRSGRGVPEA